jgi:hypothetical protein
MSRLRWLLIVLVALAAAYTAACVGGPEDPVELNPQPLPPAPGGGDQTDETTPGKGSSASSGGSSTFGDSGVNPPPKNDAGDAGDAGDGGRDQ